MISSRRIFQILFLLFLVVGSVLVIRQHATLPYVKNQGQVFGTYYHLTYQAEGDMQAVIEEQLKHVDEEFSMFNAQSTVSQLNRGEQPSLSESFVGVMKLADEVNKATSGAFDVTVAPLVNAWGFGFKTARMPSDDEVDSLLEFIGQDKIKLEQRLSGARLTKADPRVMLDFSAIAKGYGCDVVAATLRKNGVKNYLVEIGGEVVASGVNPNKQAWSVGVNKPVTDPQSNVNEIDTILTLTHGAIATSGNYRNFYVKDGRRYAHTIDPSTGRPVEHSLLSATVMAETCAKADAYATAFMVMGLDKARKVLETHPDIHALFIYSDEQGRQLTWHNLPAE